jgi:hypothetical protein
LYYKASAWIHQNANEVCWLKRKRNNFRCDDS